MKKAMNKTMKFLSMAALVLMGAVMTSCSKADDDFIDTPKQPENKSKVVTLSTTVSLDDDNTTRALDADGVKTFAVGDQMALKYYKDLGGGSKEQTTVTSEALKTEDISAGGKSAKFTFTVTDPTAGQVNYIYPAALANMSSSEWLGEQNGTQESLSSDEDYSSSFNSWDGTSPLPSATLSNVLTIAKFTIKNEGGKDITSTITDMSIRVGGIALTYHITPSSLSTIWVMMNPISSGMTIKISATDGVNRYAKTVTGKTLNAGKITPINLTMSPDPLPAGALPGQFKINSGTGVVYFSKGNLVYTGFIWTFHNHQYDRVFTSNGTATDYPMDLFTWGNIASPTVNGTTYLDGSSNLSGITDWGYNAIANGGNTVNSGWRTLSKDEWTYLFNTRTTASGVRFAKATVNDVKGVIVLPDDWSTSYYALSSTNDDKANFAANVINVVTWLDNLEAHGAVFLPAAGYRDGSDVSVSDNGFCAYWSSTASTSFDTQAHYVNITSTNLTPNANLNRYYGYSVRLVKNVE